MFCDCWPIKSSASQRAISRCPVGLLNGFSLWASRTCPAAGAAPVSQGGVPPPNGFSTLRTIPDAQHHTCRKSAFRCGVSGSPKRASSDHPSPSISRSVANATGPPVQTKRRRATSAAFLLSQQEFGEVGGGAGCLSVAAWSSPAGRPSGEAEPRSGPESLGLSPRPLPGL